MADERTPVIIEVSTSGGFGGPLTPRLDKRIVVAEQGEAAQKAYRAAFDLKVLESHADSAADMGAADMLTYHITVIDAEDNRHTFDLREDQLPETMLDLIDQVPD